MISILKSSLLLGLFLLGCVYAQDVTNTRVHQQGDSIAIEYDLEGRGKYFVQLSYSTSGQDATRESFIPLDTDKHALEGDIGRGVKSGRNKKIIWEVLKDQDGIVGEIVFNIHAEQEVIPNNTPGRLILSSSYLNNNVGIPEQWNGPVGGRIGYEHKWGFHLSFLQNERIPQTPQVPTQSIVLIGITKSLVRTWKFQWNIYPLGGINTSLESLEFQRYFYGAGTDMSIGPIHFNVDFLYDENQELSMMGGLGWNFRLR